MKVSIEIIGQEEEELARLYVLQCDRSVHALADYIRTGQYRTVEIPCTLNERTYKIGSEEIFTVETARDVQLVYTRGQVYKTTLRLYELEQLLPPDFVRISKSVILNLDQAKCYKPLLNGLMQVELSDGRTAYISRKYLKDVRDRLIKQPS